MNIATSRPDKIINCTLWSANLSDTDTNIQIQIQIQKPTYLEAYHVKLVLSPKIAFYL